VSRLLQCENCGAVLAKEDIFCGECGAPRPSQAEVSETKDLARAEVVTPAELTPRADPVPAAPARSEPASTGWRVAFIVLVVLGAIACIAGVLAFLLFGSMESEATTPAEDWLYAALCCLLPIGGTGVLLATGGLAIWYARVRNR
jgi:hypothetical protein